MSASPTLLKVHHLQVSDFLMCLICYQLSIYTRLQSRDDRSTLTCAKLINRDPHSNTSAVYTDRRGQTGCGLYEPTFTPVRLPVCLRWPSWSVRLSKHGKTWLRMIETTEEKRQTERGSRNFRWLQKCAEWSGYRAATAWPSPQRGSGEFPG